MCFPSLRTLPRIATHTPPGFKRYIYVKHERVTAAILGGIETILN